MPIFKEVSSRLHSADLYYHIIGNGDVKLFFVQGLAMSMHVWDYQIAHFRQFPQFQILLFDNRGVGGSAKPWGPYTYVVSKLLQLLF
jgi:pimeloyl-ACP methyl ester carboxylesterase